MIAILNMIMKYNLILNILTFKKGSRILYINFKKLLFKIVLFIKCLKQYILKTF